MDISILIGVLVGLAAVTPAAVTGAADIKVLSSGATAAVVEGLAPRFERETGHKIVLDSGSAASLEKRIVGGEAADVVILTNDGIDNLTKQGKIVPGSRVNVARSGIGVAVRKGAPRPDISTPDALKRALLAAKSVAYSDPARGSASSTHFLKVLERLGIAEEVKAKAKLSKGGPGGLVGDILVAGDAEIGVQQIPELMSVSGVDVIGSLPAGLQYVMDLAAAIPVNAKEPEAGKALVKFLTSPAAMSVIKALGLEPPS